MSMSMSITDLKVVTIVCIVAYLVGFTACGSTPSENGAANKAAGNSNAEQTTNAEKLTQPLKFLLIGDSLMREGFGPGLETALTRYKDVSVVREGLYSTGLNKTDFFDWTARAEEMIGQNKPDVLIVTFGANDGQGILDDQGKAHDLGTESWKEVYAQRVNRFLTRVAPKVKKIFWVGHPIPGNDKFVKKFSAMNPVYKSEAAKFPNVVYVDTWDSLALKGVYSRSLPDENGKMQVARQGDGVHVTNFGGKLEAAAVMKVVLQNIDLK